MGRLLTRGARERPDEQEHDIGGRGEWEIGHHLNIRSGEGRGKHEKTENL